MIERHFAWPVFLKGSRQTSRHRAAFSIVTSAEQYERVAAEYRATPRMRRQALVCRELAALRPIPAPPSDTIPPAFEFRSFWWRGVCVGAGPYWATSAHSVVDRVQGWVDQARGWFGRFRRWLGGGRTSQSGAGGD